METTKTILVIIGGLTIIWMIYSLLFKVKAFQIYLAAKLSGIDISLFEIMMMGVRNADASLIINSLIQLKENEIVIHIDQLQAFLIARGDLANLVNGMVYAKKEHIEIDLDRAMQLVMRNKRLKETLQIWKISNPKKTTYEG